MGFVNGFTFFISMVSFLRVTHTAFIIRNFTGYVSVSSPCDGLYRGACYNVFNSEMSAHEAERKCNDQEPDGHLVAFHTQEDVDFIKNLMINKGVHRAWIGARWSGAYHFTNGLTYEGEPIHQDDGDCVALFGSRTLRGKQCHHPLPYICEKKGDTCSDDFTLHDGSCYRWFDNRENFYTAEKKCNNIGGHLAAWQPHEQSYFWFSLPTLPPDINEVWIGLEKRFEFTDGSIYDFDLPNHTFVGSCLLMTRDQTVRGEICNSTLPYICFSTQYVATMLSEVALDLNEVFDDNITSCIPTLDLVRPEDVYSGYIYFSKYKSTMDQDNISLRVTFDVEVKCGWRKLLFTNEPDAECSTVISCSLKTNATLMTNQCDYECPCDVAGCDVTFVDAKIDYFEHEANVCEIEVF